MYAVTTLIYIIWARRRKEGGKQRRSACGVTMYSSLSFCDNNDSCSSIWGKQCDTQRSCRLSLWCFTVPVWLAALYAVINVFITMACSGRRKEEKEKRLLNGGFQEGIRVIIYMLSCGLLFSALSMCIVMSTQQFKHIDESEELSEEEERKKEGEKEAF